MVKLFWGVWLGVASAVLFVAGATLVGYLQVAACTSTCPFPLSSPFTHLTFR